MSHFRLASLAPFVLRAGLLPLAVAGVIAIGVMAAPGCGGNSLKTVHLDAGTGGCAAGLLLCNGTCTNVQSSSAHCGSCGTKCDTGQTCQKGKCVAGNGGGCLASQTDCGGGNCTDITADPMNCGACGTVCTTGQTCSASMCVDGGCPAGQTMCTAGCVDITSDGSNCGACDTVCMPGQTCQNGTCAAGNPAGNGDDCATLYNCVGPCMDQACVDTCAGSASQMAITELNDYINCVSGQCPDTNGGVCDSNSRRYSMTNCQACVQTANSGKCAASLNTCMGGGGGCAGGQVMCAGACTDTTSDPMNCGACGKACPGGQSCAAGACGAVGGGQAGCLGGIDCLNKSGCDLSDAACVMTCENQSTAMGAQLLQALLTCINKACPSTNNGVCDQNAFFFSAYRCNSCLNNAQNPGGKCATQAATCQANGP